eukprot:15460501-Alexandrium_andersonii.AAC.1
MKRRTQGRAAQSACGLAAACLWPGGPMVSRQAHLEVPWPKTAPGCSAGNRAPIDMTKRLRSLRMLREK